MASLLAAPAHAQDADPEPAQKTSVKEVSPKVAERLKLAARAIRFAEKAIPFAGNQHEALFATEGNSLNRTKVTRSQEMRRRSSAAQTATRTGNDTLAAGAATIACTAGGNCGEYSKMSMHYLAGLNSGQTITRASVQGVDHAFVLIGDLKNDTPHENVVADAWVTHGKPVLWTCLLYTSDAADDLLQV